MRKIKLLFLLSFITFSFLSGADQIVLPITNADADIIAKAYDRYTGTFYVATDRNNGDHTIAKANRDTVPVTGFTGLSAAGNRFNDEGHYVPANKQDERINNGLFGVISGLGVANPIVVAMDFFRGGVNDDEKVFSFLENNPAAVNGTERLLLADGANIASAANDSILRLATGVQRAEGEAQRGKVFVRVYPTGGIDGAQYSGVCSLNVDLTNAAIEGAPDNLRAIQLDVTSEVLGANTGGGGEVDSAQVEDMYWDDELQRLFVALNVTSNNAGADSVALGIVKASLDVDGTLRAFERPVENLPAQNEDPGDGELVDTIFIIRQDAAYDASPVVRINKIRTMKTSTGIKYLIANGGAGRITNEQVGNIVVALRLGVDGNIVQNANGNILEADWDVDRLGPTLVGGDKIPFAGAVNAFISDMEVVGDTVYVSFHRANRDKGNDPGVWSSTAMFDNNGVIIDWTKWERVFPSLQTAADADEANLADKAWFFAVDAKNGQLWQVNENAVNRPRIVRRTKIQTDFSNDDLYAQSLQRRLNADLANGCTCVLDLPEGTRGLGNGDNLHESIAMFGGIEKVVFARTKYEAERAVAVNFTDGANYKLTRLPSGAGAVRCLGYSHNDRDETRGYFFAGTDKGFYVYAAPGGEGYNNSVNGFGALDAAPFDDGIWQPMAENLIQGPVTHIDADGDRVYIVVYDLTSGQFGIARFNIEDGGDNVVEMFNSAEEAAQSGSGNIPPNAIFTGFKLVTDAGGLNNAGFISTNKGVFRSIPTLHTSDTDSVWTRIGDEKAYHSLYAPKRVKTAAANEDGATHRVYGIAIADDDRGLNYYQNSTLHQFGFPRDRNNGAELVNPMPPAADGRGFTNFDLGQATDPLNYLDRSTFFWTDGARRFYTRFNATETTFNMLRSLPYYGAEWNMTVPEVFSQLNGIRIHWIENISGLGIVLAGTDTGVISLVE